MSAPTPATYIARRARLLLRAGLAWLSISLAWAAPAAAETLTVAVSRGTVSLPLYVAEARGYFRQERADVALRDCSSGRACFQMLGDGTAQAATGAELLVTMASFKRDDLAIIATLSASYRQIKLIARRGGGTRDAELMQGRRIATVRGTSAEYFLDSWLVFNDVDPSRVTFVALAPDQLIDALKRREVDAIAIWEPIASNAVAALGDDALSLPTARVYTQHFSLAADRHTIAARAQDLSKLLRALIRSQQFITENPAAAAAILQARLGIEREAAERALKEQDFRIRLDQSLVSTMESQARWAIRGGQGDALDKPANLLRSIEPSLLRTVAPEAVGLAR